MNAQDSEDSRLRAEIAELEAVADKGAGAKMALYARKCGPGWLQGAITLGGGSLSGSLYLGVVMGYHMLWLQPLAMILGVIMLSAISYVTLSTGLRPLRSINDHVSPALGWGWLIATLMANIVWCLPQFSLATAAIKQNLAPNLEVRDYTVCAVVLAITFCVILLYEKGGAGLRIFEAILKIMVAIIVLCFVGVVLKMAGELPWGAIFGGLIPRFGMLTSPAPVFQEAISQTGENAAYWTSRIVGDQRDKMITAFATAVGINMTFLLPYSMLRKGWGKPHRGLAIFDLSTGLVIPFVVATGCVVIASASQFHGKYDDILQNGAPTPETRKGFNDLVDGLIKDQAGQDSFAGMTEGEKQSARDRLPEPDKKVAAMLYDRDAFRLAGALEPLTGDFVAQKVFGVGVLGMAVSTIIILMLISGFTFCEMFNKPGSRPVHLTGCIIAGVGGSLAPFLWAGKAKLALAIPTSVMGGALLPIAYVTFFLLMNSKSLLGNARPEGWLRLRWNLLMGVATIIAMSGSIWVLKSKTMEIAGSKIPIGKFGIALLVGLLVIGLVQFALKSKKNARERA